MPKCRHQCCTAAVREVLRNVANSNLNDTGASTVVDKMYANIKRVM